MIRDQQQFQKIQNNVEKNFDSNTRFPSTREEVQREEDQTRKQCAEVFHQETRVKKTWTHGH